eukprot:m.48224 g.48224  ORF g.48224 m.48224 type:complete len:282 (+) comp6021_c0_seq1:29-874(+)
MKAAIRTLAAKAADPFGHAGQAAGYAVYRPMYPPQLLERVSEYCGLNRDLCVDVATGTGQIASVLAQPKPEGLGFKRVIAFDRSKAQLSQAAAHIKIHYCEGDAYKMPAATHSADLITTGQAAHWFDMPRYLAEVNRVLRPGGTLAIMGYGVCHMADPVAERVFKEYYAALGSHQLPNTPGCYWDCDRVLLDSGLREVTFTPPLQPDTVSREWFYDRRTFTAREFEGYLLTWSAYRAYKETHPDRPDIVKKVMKALLRSGAPEPWTVEFPFFLILGRTPAH